MTDRDRFTFDGVDLSAGPEFTIHEVEPYVPPSVRYGNRRKRLGWWVKGRRQALALWLAPWLRGDL